MMQIKELLLLSFFYVSAFANAQNPTSATLTITVEGCVKPVGSVFVALYDTEADFLNKEYVGVSKYLDDASLTFNFDTLYVGRRYAVAVFHDQNNNKKMDKNMFGIPSEPYAFGNNSMGFMGPPTFFEASILLKPSDNVMVIKLE